MSEEQKKTGLDLKPAQIVAGALAAVTAALLGSRLNVAGTIAGAGIASVVSTIGAALYQRSIERTRESVRKVGSKAWVIKPVDGDAGETPEADEEPTPGRALRWQVIAGGSVLVFVLGMLAVTGVEWVRGAPLSGGERGTTLGWITGAPTGGPKQEPQWTSTPPSTTEPVPSTTTQPGTTPSVPSTTTGSGAPTTTSIPLPSSSTVPPTTTSSPDVPKSTTAPKVDP